MQGLLLREQLDDTFHSAGVTPRRTQEVASSQLACALVAEGAGITIADELVGKAFAHHVAMVPIEPERWMTFGTLSARSNPLSEAAQTFSSYLIAHTEHLCTDSATLQKV
jgi:DNA-binding transcriptional LysR family regulator